MAEPLLIAKNAQKDITLLPRLANRHGLITGATGTGKTVTLQKMAEAFSSIGVPVFMADVKGDLSGAGAAGVASEKLMQRLAALGITEYTPRANPVVFWDVFGAGGHPVRATISDMGPLLIARLLNLNDTQAGVLQLVFKIADDNGLLLLDLKDLRAMIQHVGDNAKSFTTEYGNVSAASIGAIQRGLLALEQEGGDSFFGEPMLDLADLIQADGDGRGVINILAAEKLYQSPKLYSTFLLWMLSELFEQLPEVGDMDKPKLVFFFDEAHLLFSDAPKALVEKVEQVVRLIRSKGVGVYFVTQNPLDVPETVLGQLGNRVQHALRAFTPRDQKAVKTAAETMRANPAFDAATAITELGVGEALVSFLDDKGRPDVVERAFVIAPASRLGPLTPEERKAAIQGSVLYGHYEQQLDRESAYEKLRGQGAAGAAGTPTGAPAGQAPAGQEGGGMLGGMSDILFGSTGPRGGKHEGLVEVAAKTVVRTISSSVGREIVRGLLGSLLGGRRR
ncbi:helicase HerA-like domain-containing protein [Azoarcus sp. DN11]|uniref:helicase HerA-like domain-containing protein n=1 Tax=Azoarcus sp. DN11 TaxID=356837 RepID=UPI000EAB4AE2|nr:helicase HerA-like domain-containing protein [Azoarcus sp. DN11]AYH42238.1 ATP-binding protein [Azoarcus sp. DN11]